MPTDPRLAALEHQNRLLRSTLFLSIIALVTCGGVTSDYERVNTNYLVIVDAQGQPTITLTSDGGGTITFHGATSSAVLDAEAVAELLAVRSAASAR